MTPTRARTEPLFPHLPAATRTAALRAAQHLTISTAILLMSIIGSALLINDSPRNLTEPLTVGLSISSAMTLTSAAVIHCRAQTNLPVIRALHHRAEHSPTLLMTALLLALTSPALVLPTHPNLHDAALVTLTLGIPGLLSATALSWLHVTCGYRRSRPRPRTQQPLPQQPAT